MPSRREIASVIFLALAICSSLQVSAQSRSLLAHSTEPSSPFSLALDQLQKNINYTFDSTLLLRRAMTHASFSEENNKALSILGASVIEASLALHLLLNDVDVSSKDVNFEISANCSVDSCAVDGFGLRLQDTLRVSPKTDSATPAVVCGAFRGLIGAIAVDAKSSDLAGRVFWSVHDQHKGRALACLQLQVDGSCGESASEAQIGDDTTPHGLRGLHRRPHHIARRLRPRLVIRAKAAARRLGRRR